jgi:hypothetical protein
MADELASGYRPSQRRQLIEYFAFIRFSSSLLPGVLWAKLQEQKTQNDLAVFRTSLTRRLLHKLVKTGLDLSTHHAKGDNGRIYRHGL